METENPILTHRKLQEMQGYQLDNTPQLHAAMYTYIDLAEVKLWGEVRPHPCTALKAIYFTARRSQEGSWQLILPLSHTSSDGLSMERLATLHAALRHSEQERGSMEERETWERLTIALVGSDSTILYYHVWSGIH